MRTKAGLCGVLLSVVVPVVGAEVLVGSAFVGREPTAAERAAAVALVTTAETYIACLQAVDGDAWLGKPDFSACDGARAAYAKQLGADVADAAIGCLEEGAIGAPRITSNTCAALHERFAAAPKVKLEGGAP